MTDIKKRHFCKSVALLSLIPLLKIDFLSANTNVQNSVLSGSVIVNGKKVSKNSDLDFNQITDVETGNQLSLIKNGQDGFLPIKSEAKYVAEVKTFKNFVINIPSDINIYDYNTIVIWCERFEEFITAAKYQ
jgi:hypothetical protein